jgi:hypothetical protein
MTGQIFKPLAKTNHTHLVIEKIKWLTIATCTGARDTLNQFSCNVFYSFYELSIVIGILREGGDKQMAIEISHTILSNQKIQII